MGIDLLPLGKPKPGFEKGFSSGVSSSVIPRRLIASALVVVPLVWLVVWYILWLDNDDCLGALLQLGGVDDALYASTFLECTNTSSRLNSVQTWWVGAVFCFELIMYWRLRLIRKK